MKGKFLVKIQSDRCKGCEICIDECPSKILVRGNELNSRGLLYIEVTNTEKCIGCRRCAVMCPDVAIHIEQDGE